MGLFFRFLRTLRNNILEPEVYHLNPAKSDTKFFRTLVKWTPEMFASYAAYANKVNLIITCIFIS